ncbi:MAG: glycosyltransferase [Bacteroidales bacterium]|jgi:GT2 family glycosyltransferase|nr:glycosyltransferase [Bacteroidales bacterium]
MADDKNMQLSIIIVNYKVKYFLDQCLQSVMNATANMATEVFVVDNHSEDGALEMIREKYPEVICIANEENVGFSRANNQALKLASGKYQLLLNPDTLVQSDTFEKCIKFMETHEDAGGLGVKMINGKGEFLPESKRGLPMPGVAFYKIFGLSKFFPKSKKFGSYHLTYLSPEENHSVDVLSGAFMMMRKSVLAPIGYLDEDYFMYGEDIDLSYRITKAGYKNYYFSETQIIHYKGESTKKDSINYVFIFYKAMQIFAKKQLSEVNTGLLHGLINLAIWIRAGLAILKRVLTASMIYVLDFLVLLGGVWALSDYWETNVLQTKGSGFPNYYYYFVLPLYVVVWIICVKLWKGYKKPVSLSATNKGVILGSAVILLIYALLPESARFSRAVIVLSSMWALIALNFTRYLLAKIGVSGYRLNTHLKKRVAVVGTPNEAWRVAQLAQMHHSNIQLMRIIEVSESSSLKQKSAPLVDELIVGQFSDLKEMIKSYRFNEIIFCARDMSYNEIISCMEDLHAIHLDFKIISEDSQVLIGSNSLQTTEMLFKEK